MAMLTTTTQSPIGASQPNNFNFNGMIFNNWPVFSFKYGVSDALSGANFGHEESEDGGGSRVGSAVQPYLEYQGHCIAIVLSVKGRHWMQSYLEYQG